MKKLFFVLPILILLLVVPSASASGEKSKKIEVTTLKSTEIVDRNYFAVNDRVEIHGTVNGDTFVAGGMVLVDGKINGDLIVAGGEVTISGEVSDDVRVAGGQVRVSGKIGKNLTAIGGNVDITESASIGKSLVVVGGNVNLSAPVTETINAGVGSLTINSSVGGDIDAAVGMLRVTSEASIDGNINYWSNEQASIDDEANVTGEVSKHDPVVDKTSMDFDEEKILGIIAGFALTIKIVNLIAWFVLGLILIHFFPQFFAKSNKVLKEKAWPSLGFGFLALVATPVIAVALLVTLIGIPIGIMLFALYGIVLYFAHIPVIYLIGEWVLSKFGKTDHKVWSLIVGLIIYGILTTLPVIGSIFGFFATLFGLGAWIISEEQVYKEARKKNLI